jgi:hypothetical protein
MKPLCRSCRFFVYRNAFVAGKREEWPACEKQVAGFPVMIKCRDWEREIGSDDE